jgi:magnesium transporter
MTRRYVLEGGKLVQSDSPDAPIEVCITPERDEVVRLVEDYALEEYNVNSALDPDEVSRLELEDDHVMLILKRPKDYTAEDEYLFRVSSVGVFLFADRLLVICPEDTRIFEGRQPSKLWTLRDAALRLIYGTISHFLGHLKTINLMTEEIEHKINYSMENTSLLHMFTMEKSLVYYLNGINSNAMLFSKMRASATRLGFSEDNLEMLEDIIIENTQCSKQADVYASILSSMMDARASIVNNNLNMLIKRLTIISIVFLPLNVIASIGGMSEFSEWTKGLDWRIAYALFSVGLVAIAFITWLLIRGMGAGKSGGGYGWRRRRK